MRYTDLRFLLVADGGSTKAAWQLFAGTRPVLWINTAGINPSVLTHKKISDILSAELLPSLAITFSEYGYPELLEVAFFGAGCTPAASGELSSILDTLLSGYARCLRITVDSDIAGAIMAAPQTGRCIVGIIGTGSNTCVAENGNLIASISPGGYILGDEGSATWIGRRLAAYYLRKMLPGELNEIFEQKFSITPQELIRRVYRPIPSEQAPNRFLGQLAPFATQHAPAYPLLMNILKGAAAAFYENYIDLYTARGEASADTPLFLVGSVAEAISPFLSVEAAIREMAAPVVTADPLPAIASHLILKFP